MGEKEKFSCSFGSGVRFIKLDFMIVNVFKS